MIQSISAGVGDNLSSFIGWRVLINHRFAIKVSNELWTSGELCHDGCFVPRRVVSMCPVPCLDGVGVPLLPPSQRGLCSSGFRGCPRA